jgi:puromycin-sensitive aminopeptidase
MSTPVDYRLPRDVSPRRYELEIAPDLDAGTFEGKVTAAIELVAARRSLVLNAEDLVLDEVRVEAGEREWAGTVEDRPELQQVVLEFPEALPPGVARLSIRYHGRLAQDLRGFYRAVVREDGGRETVIAATQCEATEARRVFPGWDEPDFKATFAVTLVVAPGLAAFSNGREIARVTDPDGRQRITFAETVPMSSYLLALAVGPFAATDPVMAGRTPIRVVARPKFLPFTAMALHEAERHLLFFEDYFGLPYPGDKLDHIAIPDFASGAMENLGLITYREEALLANPDQASPMERLQVSSTIAHETAHMWFGDLVTMRWWNGLWLNEAFATFMSTLAVDALHPDWAVWTHFGRGRAYALKVDGLASTRPVEYPVTHPDEARGMFDALTYQKGAALLRMLEQYLGPSVFQAGIRHYLNAHRFGNTETGDLWDALEAASGQPVRQMMDQWVFQGGYPLIRAEQPGPGQLTLSAQPFRYLGSGTGSWLTPVLVSVHDDRGAVTRIPVTVGPDPVTVAVGDRVSFLVVNAGGHGFYRSTYDAPLFQALTAHWEQLDGAERLGVLDDVWAAVLAGQAPLEQAFGLWARLGAESDPDVVGTMAEQMATLENVADAAGREALARFVRAVARPALLTVGWEPAPGEDVRRARLRAGLVSLLGLRGDDPAVQAEARRILDRQAEGAAMPPELLSAAATVAVHEGRPEYWEHIRAAYQSAQDPQAKTRYLYALAYVRTPDLVARTLSFFQSETVKLQDLAYAIGYLLRNRHARRAAWDVVEQRWDEYSRLFPQEMLGVAFYLAMGDTVEEDLAQRMDAFVDAHPIPAVARQVAQAREFQAVHQALRRRVGSEVARVAARATPAD